MIEVLDAPLPVTVQDAGRPGYRHLGVPLSGALDAEWLAIANALAGNPPTMAGLEMRLLGPRLRAQTPVTVALSGECDARIEDAVGMRRPAKSWRTHSLTPGETLVIGSLRDGLAYLAFAGGLELPAVLGSRSTYARAGLGGIDGRALKVGDLLKVSAGGTATPLRLTQAPRLADGPLRVIAGPQREHFTDAAWQHFLDAEFTVSREADRMGLRLDGPRLEHDPARGADIVSDAVTPGAVQVPGDGRPIVLLADCQTVGGYPKIATVIGADLPRLGHALPGQRLRFAEVSIEQALAARREAATALAACIAGMVPNHAVFNSDALYGANLIDGVIDAQHTN
jgi:5-oxoprolinase (ATP-hydrolysing) subunit C